MEMIGGAILQEYSSLWDARHREKMVTYRDGRFAPTGRFAAALVEQCSKSCACEQFLSLEKGAIRIPSRSAVAFRCESRQSTAQGQTTPPALGPVPDSRPHRVGHLERHRRCALPERTTTEDRLPPTALVLGPAAADLENSLRTLIRQPGVKS